MTHAKVNTITSVISPLQYSEVAGLMLVLSFIQCHTTQTHRPILMTDSSDDVAFFKDAPLRCNADQKFHLEVNSPESRIVSAGNRKTLTRFPAYLIQRSMVKHCLYHESRGLRPGKITQAKS